MRHFSRAVKIAKRLVDVDDQHNVILSLLDRMPVALVLVDETGILIDTNRLADEMIASNLGISIKLNHIDLGTENNHRLLDVIHEMSKHDSSATRGKSLSITNEQTQNNIMLSIKRQQLHYLFLKENHYQYHCQINFQNSIIYQKKSSMLLRNWRGA